MVGGEPVDKARRRFIKAAIAGAAIAFAAFSREELKKMLVPVRLEDIIAEAATGETPLEEKAREKEVEVRRWCMEEAERICSRYGRGSPACEEALRRCEMIRVKATPARKGARYAMALDLNKCIGCRRCVYACVMENNQARNLGIEWITVVSVDRERFPELLDSNAYYETAPEKDKVYVPVSCMHCENPPCVMVCPVGATWKEPDGIVVVDYDKCIGCRYCIAACPYGARRFNWAPPYVPVTELNPDMHVLGNVPRQVHVVEKCTWCIHRVREGGVPACVEACPVGARVFGDLNDPNSPIRRVIEEYGVFVLKPEAGTRPRFFYFFGPSRTKGEG